MSWGTGFVAITCRTCRTDTLAGEAIEEQASTLPTKGPIWLIVRCLLDLVREDVVKAGISWGTGFVAITCRTCRTDTLPGEAVEEQASTLPTKGPMRLGIWCLRCIHVREDVVEAGISWGTSFMGTTCRTRRTDTLAGEAVEEQASTLPAKGPMRLGIWCLWDLVREDVVEAGISWGTGFVAITCRTCRTDTLPGEAVEEQASTLPAKGPMRLGIWCLRCIHVREDVVEAEISGGTGLVGSACWTDSLTGEAIEEEASTLPTKAPL